MRVQSVLDSDARFSRGIKESLCFPGGNFASISESFEIKSISCKRGGERFFDIIYHTVVFVDKGSPFLVAGRWLAVVYYLADDGSWHDLNDELMAQGLAIPIK